MIIDYQLFTDAEAGEDGAEEGIGGDVTGEGGEIVDGLADVLSEEVAGELGVDGVDYAGEVGGGCA